MQKGQSGLRGWIRTIADIAVIMLIVLAAKTAIAEPFYVPSGSMEPTLLIGDELLAMKYPYGYSSASLPSFFVFPNTQRVFSALPKRGDVVVFRWPGDRSQVWVKRVIGLPGDRIGVSHGQVRIDDRFRPATHPQHLQPLQSPNCQKAEWIRKVQKRERFDEISHSG